MYLLSVRFLAPLRQNRPIASDANRRVIDADDCSGVLSEDGFERQTPACSPPHKGEGSTPSLWLACAELAT